MALGNDDVRDLAGKEGLDVTDDPLEAPVEVLDARRAILVPAGFDVTLHLAVTFADGVNLVVIFLISLLYYSRSD
jgi:hypothetical protein